MLKFKIVAIALLFVIIIVPFTAYSVKNDNKDDNNTKRTEDIYDMEILLYRTESKSVQKINGYEYICAVVAGEMPANFEAEALKAQTVAAFTYMLNKMNYVKENPDVDIGHAGGYVCDDYSHCKAYLSKNEALEKWGKSWFEKYYPRIEDAVSSVFGKYITYDGQPVNAVFHAISNGNTCSAKEVWGNEVSYLTSVSCESDKNAEGYKTEAEFTTKEFADVFYEQLGVTLPNDSENWIGEITKTQSGMVDEIVIADTSYDGTHIRKMFSLRSSTFDIDVTKNRVIFTIYGYGHGVGMSQYGANDMAKSGCSYTEILTHFYTGVKIEDYKV